MESYGAFCDEDKDEGVNPGVSDGAARPGAEHKEEGATSNPHIDAKYVQELNAEKTMLDHETFPHSIRLVSHEINRVTLGGDQLLDLLNDKPTKVAVKVRVPVHEFPKFNFIGKLLGPKGNTLKRLQDETGCRIAVYGRGSMRDKTKEDELRRQGGKYAHLTEDLHVYIESYGHPIDVYRRVSMALCAVRRHLVPDYNDDITQSQVQELVFINGRGPAPIPPRPRGPPPPPPHMMGVDYRMGPGPFPPRPPFGDSRGGKVGGLGRGGSGPGGPGPRGASLAAAGGVRRGDANGRGVYSPRAAGAPQGSISGSPSGGVGVGGGYSSNTAAAGYHSSSINYDYGLSGGSGGLGVSNNNIGGAGGNDFYNSSFDNFNSKSSDISPTAYGHMGR